MRSVIIEGLKLFFSILTGVLLVGTLVKLVYMFCLLIGFDEVFSIMISGFGTVGSIMATVMVMLQRRELL